MSASILIVDDTLENLRLLRSMWPDKAMKYAL